MKYSATPFRLAMLGMIEGNGHPYSWSAIVNGFDPEAMKRCPYPAILDYLGKQKPEEVGIPGAAVTHIWTDRPEEAPMVAAASLIPNVVERPENVIGEVDGVVIATDDGDDHVERVRPFIEAGIPVFVDKPMATNPDDLRTFRQWSAEGHYFQSSSGMRYAPETSRFLEARHGVGDLRWVTSFTCKTWERYGIHALELLAPILGPGWISVTASSDERGDIMQLEHETKVRVTLGAIHDAYGSFGVVHLYGTNGHYTYRASDTYRAFRGQMLALIDGLRTRTHPFPQEDTFELMAAIIAGRLSRERGGERVSVAEVLETTRPRA